MKKVTIWVTCVLFMGLLIGVTLLNTREIYYLNKTTQVLAANEATLVRLNEGLSKAISDVAASMIEKSEWDKKVAEKIRELDTLLKGNNVNTNQIVSGAVR